MNDVELESWRGQWHTAPSAPIDLTAHVEREPRATRRATVGEVVIAIVFGGGSIIWAMLSRRTEALALALGVAAFIAVAWTISVLLRRDAWAPATLSTVAFLDQSILRCRRRHEAIAAQASLYVLIVGSDLAWIYFFERPPGANDLWSLLTSGSIAWIWGVTAILGGAAARRRVAISRELEILTRLRAGLDEDTRQSTGEQSWKSRIANVQGFRRRKRRGGWSVRS